jgi:SAM-dependent methyltransferase
MLSAIFAGLTALSPRLRHNLWRRWYDGLTAGYQAPDWTFMNYGFADLDPMATPLHLSADAEPDRYNIQLYYQVAGAVPLNGCTAAEIGCGRGGGSAYVAQAFTPERFYGLDFAANAVGFCRRRHQADNLHFLVGDSTALPFGTATMDAIVNVESSHCYPSFSGFIAEVNRVLRPGGHFLWADLRVGEDMGSLRRSFEHAGFEVVTERDITANVLAAMGLMSRVKESAIAGHVPRYLRRSFADFAGVTGTKVHRLLETGRAVYCHFTLRKSERF